MESKKTVALSIIIAALIFTGCAPMYVPNVANAPLLSNKGEVQAAIYGGTAGIDPQLAYAVTNNIGIMLNGSFEDSKSDTTDSFHKHQFVELGLGYYKKLNKTGRFEIFGGYGIGTLQALDEQSFFKAHSDVTSNRIFIQPAFGLTTENIDFSFASRFVVLNVKQGEFEFSRSFIEPVLTTKFGFEHVKAVFQVGYSIPLHSDNVFNINYQPLLLSIGLHGSLNKIFEE